MTKTEKAGFFGVSLTTLQNWARQGCPVDADDVGAIAEWKTARDLRQAGYPDDGFAELIGEHARRVADLNARIAEVNSWPLGTQAEPGMIKVATLFAFKLERALLELPDRILQAGPSGAPAVFYRIALDSLDEFRGEISDDDIPPITGKKHGSGKEGMTCLPRIESRPPWRQRRRG